MRGRLRVLWEVVNEGMWLIAGTMSVGAVLLALVMPRLDRAWYGSSQGSSGQTANSGSGPPNLYGLIYDGGPEGARTLLSSIASGSTTLLGLVLSVTVVTLSLASQQYGPRLLRTFMKDRITQATIGAFLASTFYPLLLIRSINGPSQNGGGDAFVPYLSVTLALLLAVFSLGMLIWFFSDIARQIQAPHIIASVGEDLDRGIDNMLSSDPRRLHDADAEDANPDEIEQPQFPKENLSLAAVASEEGFVLAIDKSELVDVACQGNVYLRLAVDPGSYVFEGSALVWADADLDAAARQRLADAFTVGKRRTVAQDVPYCINQLAEVAVRAMSPGINDPFTAENCVDRLSAAMARLVNSPFPDPFLYDDQDVPRVLTRRPSFHYLMKISFDPIRRHTTRSVMVSGRMLENLGRLAESCDRPERRRVMLQIAEEIREGMDPVIGSDAKLLDEQVARVRRACQRT